MRYETLYEKFMKNTTSTVSSKGMALSLETAALVLLLCEIKQPKTIVDLGSGFSSYVLRKWAQGAKHDVVVWSVVDAAGSNLHVSLALIMG